MLISTFSCEKEKKEINYPKTEITEEALIPKPIEVIATNSAFGLDNKTLIYTNQTVDGFNKIGEFLAKKIHLKTNLNITVNTTSRETIERIIYINQIDSLDLDSPEAYQLHIKKDSIYINATTAAGAFRGVQTLRQLIPEKTNDTLTNHPMWLIPTGKIKDAPNFEYRSAMLDVARHFFTVDEVKKYIDVLAYYKYNTFHMHLSDDQGWRIEIKSWPKLTEIGSKTEVGGSKGGFYTQEEYKDIVAYAAERYIQVIPEIDMPGHTNAASLSYSILHAGGKAEKPRVRTDMKVGYSSLATRKDTIYKFVDDIIREISAISPSPYFHIGGDESYVTKKRDYIHFIEKVDTIVTKYGKTMIGWEEITQAKTSKNSIVQFWKDSIYALKAIQKNKKLIYSPANKVYLDMKYDSLSKYGLNWAGYIPVDIAYNWNFETYIKSIPKKNIIGIEAPLWSETISNSDELEYLAFPRAIGHAELGWSIPENRNWEDYKKRLLKQSSYLKRSKINFYKTPLLNWDE